MKPRPPATVSGAAVQACAIAWLATVAPTPHWLTAFGLVQELRMVTRTDIFQRKLQDVERLAGNTPAYEAAVLGTGIAAAEAVPAALFAFIRHIDLFTAAVTQSGPARWRHRRDRGDDRRARNAAPEIKGKATCTASP